MTLSPYLQNTKVQNKACAFQKNRKSQAVKYMLNGIYDAIKGYLTSRKTLNNEKQTHDRANKCLKKRMYMP